jgi:hypothetical protein
MKTVTTERSEFVEAIEMTFRSVTKRNNPVPDRTIAKTVTKRNIKAIINHFITVLTSTKK